MFLGPRYTQMKTRCYLKNIRNLKENNNKVYNKNKKLKVILIQNKNRKDQNPFHTLNIDINISCKMIVDG